MHCVARPARRCEKAFEAGIGISFVSHQLDVFLFEPSSDRYLGRLCSFSKCPKGKRDCLVPGCGEIPSTSGSRISSRVPTFWRPAAHAMLYQRGTGRLRSALDLPTVVQDRSERRTSKSDR